MQKMFVWNALTEFNTWDLARKEGQGNSGRGHRYISTTNIDVREGYLSDSRCG